MTARYEGYGAARVPGHAASVASPFGAAAAATFSAPDAASSSSPFGDTVIPSRPTALWFWRTSSVIEVNMRRAAAILPLCHAPS